MHSIHGLVSSVIDYAGLYPPAQLDPKTTLQNYARLHGSPRDWMLGRLVWPATKLEDLSTLAVGLAPEAVAPETLGAWAISCVVAPAGSPQFIEDVDLIQQFNEVHEREGEAAMRIDSIEMVANDAASIEVGLSQLPDDIFPYFEVAVDRDPRGMIAALVGEEAGAKFRTGGTTPQAHPAPEDLARGIHACASAGVAFKATAGLHRALCHFNLAAGARQFGFLNVFIGAAMTYARKLDVEGLTRFLTVESVDEIDFSEKALMWKGVRISSEEIVEARARFVHSFGSCSFDEPWDDLVAMEVIRAVASGGAA